MVSEFHVAIRFLEQMLDAHCKISSFAVELHSVEVKAEFWNRPACCPILQPITYAGGLSRQSTCFFPDLLYTSIISA